MICGNNQILKQAVFVCGYTHYCFVVSLLFSKVLCFCFCFLCLDLSLSVFPSIESFPYSNPVPAYCHPRSSRSAPGLGGPKYLRMIWYSGLVHIPIVWCGCPCSSGPMASSVPPLWKRRFSIVSVRTTRLSALPPTSTGKGASLCRSLS